MITLEQINARTCVHEFNAKRNSRPEPETEHCRACPYVVQDECDKYKALGNCEIRYSQVRL